MKHSGGAVCFQFPVRRCGVSGNTSMSFEDQPWSGFTRGSAAVRFLIGQGNDGRAASTRPSKRRWDAGPRVKEEPDE